MGVSRVFGGKGGVLVGCLGGVRKVSEMVFWRKRGSGRDMGGVWWCLGGVWVVWEGSGGFWGVWGLSGGGLGSCEMGQEVFCGVWWVLKGFEECLGGLREVPLNSPWSPPDLYQTLTKHPPDSSLTPARPSGHPFQTTPKPFPDPPDTPQTLPKHPQTPQDPSTSDTPPFTTGVNIYSKNIYLDTTKLLNFFI